MDCRRMHDRRQRRCDRRHLDCACNAGFDLVVGCRQKRIDPGPFRRTDESRIEGAFAACGVRSDDEERVACFWQPVMVQLFEREGSGMHGRELAQFCGRKAGRGVVRACTSKKHGRSIGDRAGRLCGCPIALRQRGIGKGRRFGKGGSDLRVLQRRRRDRKAELHEKGHGGRARLRGPAASRCMNPQSAVEFGEDSRACRVREPDGHGAARARHAQRSHYGRRISARTEPKDKPVWPRAAMVVGCEVERLHGKARAPGQQLERMAHAHAHEPGIAAACDRDMVQAAVTDARSQRRQGGRFGIERCADGRTLARHLVAREAHAAKARRVAGHVARRFGAQGTQALGIGILRIDHVQS